MPLLTLELAMRSPTFPTMTILLSTTPLLINFVMFDVSPFSRPLLTRLLPLAIEYANGTMPAHVREAFRGQTPLTGLDNNYNRYFRTGQQRQGNHYFRCLAEVLSMDYNAYNRAPSTVHFFWGNQPCQIISEMFASSGDKRELIQDLGLGSATLRYT